MPKALVTLGGEPLVTHAVRRLLATGGVSHVVVVVPASHASEFAAVLGRFDESPVPVSIVEGGAERSDSVRCGLRALHPECRLVLVHDAARCLAPPALGERVLAALAAGADAVIPGVAVTDTIKVVDGGLGSADGADLLVLSTPPRAALRAVQTPQGFQRAALASAHESGLDATDDAALVERAGGRVIVIEGDTLALKITTPIDMVVAEHLLTDASEADPA